MTPEDVDLRTSYLGLSLASSLVASASPVTGNLDAVRRLVDAGIGAIVLPSLFEEQLLQDAMVLDRLLELGEDAEATGYFPDLDDYNTGADHYLALVERIRATVPVPVIASLNGTTEGGWLRYARLLEFAGADALELNLYSVEADPYVSSGDVETRDVELVAALCAAVAIPVAVKVGPFFTAFANFAGRIVQAGASGLVLFNRFYQPDIDLETLTVEPRLVLSTSDELRLPLRWTAILRPQLAASIAVTTGVHTADDVLKCLLAGADVTMMAAALLRHGPEHVASVERDLRAWLAEHDYVSVDQLRGSMSQAAVPDPAAFERANYLRTITGYPH